MVHGEETGTGRLRPICAKRKYVVLYIDLLAHKK
jgi:hypothetical protein